MRPINFDWESGTATIEWLSPSVGLIRFLYPELNELPFRGVCSIETTGGEYEFKGMMFRAGDAPTLAEHRAIKGYLASLGLKGISRRLKHGNVVVKQYRNSRNQTKRSSEMAGQNVKISMDVTNDDGSKFFSAEVNYFNVSPAGVVSIEDKQLGVIQALHAEAQAAVAG